jgi:hypothetical protein
VAKRTRPECLAAVAFLATRVTMSDEVDMEKLMRLLGYMLATPHRGIAFKIGKFMSLNAFIDAASTIHGEIVWLNPKLTNTPPPCPIRILILSLALTAKYTGVSLCLDTDPVFYSMSCCPAVLSLVCPMSCLSALSSLSVTTDYCPGTHRLQTMQTMIH